MGEGGGREKGGKERRGEESKEKMIIFENRFKERERKRQIDELRVHKGPI